MNFKLWILPLFLVGILYLPVGAQEKGCVPHTSDTFPFGMVWWRVDPDRAPPAEAEASDAWQAAYLVIGVRPDGILVQNRESRYPRLLGWPVLARGQISVDGRRTWQSGCAAAGGDAGRGAESGAGS